MPTMALEHLRKVERKDSKDEVEREIWDEADEWGMISEMTVGEGLDNESSKEKQRKGVETIEGQK